MTFPASKVFWPAYLWLMLVPASHGQGTIVYQNPTNIPLFGDGAQYDLDLNQDGATDFQLRKSGGTFAAHGIESNASLTTPEDPPSLGVYILPLTNGDYIGPSLMPSQIWFETYLYEPIPGLIYEVPAYFHGCTTDGCGPDPFHDVTAFWGVQFAIEGNTHYGWVQVATLDGIRVGGTILDWAYNSLPGQPVLAGQVPEPGTWALLSAGSIACLILKTRRRLK